ncbi:MAG: acyltransferase [Candidatus Heteroscillospira sp.]|jgi:surface polysaccharide O-acyltransferase-like enzyme
MRRAYWADALRVLASAMVVVIHVCGSGWYELRPTGADWWTVNLLDSLCRSSVPIFFMLSGAMLLDREPEEKKLLIKTARLLLLWVLMGAFYALKDGEPAEILTHPVYFLSLILKSHYHLWFLPTLAGIYLILPVLRALVSYRDGKWVKWYLAVFFLFGILRQTMAQVPVPGETYAALRRALVPELCQYSGYFVLGWYLTRQRSRTAPWKLMLAYLGSAAAIALGTQYWSGLGAGNDERMYSYMGLFVFIEAVSLMSLMYAHCPGSGKKPVELLSPLTLGIYLLHPAAMEIMRGFGLSVELFPRPVSVPLIAFLSFCLSALCTAMLRKLPVMKKLL